MIRLRDARRGDRARDRGRPRSLRRRWDGGLAPAQAALLAQEMGEAVSVLALERATREEMLHDARSTLAAIRLANAVLARAPERGGVIPEGALRDAVGSELARLEYLLDADTPRPVRAFDPVSVIAPVVAVARVAGLVIRLDAGDCPPVLGRPADLATVLHTLLANAARYAGDSRVEVTVAPGARAVRLIVADGGPGVDDADADRIFERGGRGARTLQVPGSGLGLYVARCIMLEQGGVLDLERHGGTGARFVVDLPLASVAGAVEPARDAEVAS